MSINEDIPRNMVSMDDLIGYLIQKGKIQFLGLFNVEDGGAIGDERIVMHLVLRVPIQGVALGTATWGTVSFLGKGITMGHAAQDIVDQVEREV